MNQFEILNLYKKEFEAICKEDKQFTEISNTFMAAGFLTKNIALIMFSGIRNLEDLVGKLNSRLEKIEKKGD